jgi:hypothetical protein
MNCALLLATLVGGGTAREEAEGWGGGWWDLLGVDYVELLFVRDLWSTAAPSCAVEMEVVRRTKRGVVVLITRVSEELCDKWFSGIQLPLLVGHTLTLSLL